MIKQHTLNTTGVNVPNPTPILECAKCQLNLTQPGSKPFRFYSTLERSGGVTVIEALHTIFEPSQGSSAPTIFPPCVWGKIETRCFCRKCANQLFNLYREWKKFLPSEDSTSYLAERIRSLRAIQFTALNVEEQRRQHENEIKISSLEKQHENDVKTIQELNLKINSLKPLPLRRSMIAARRTKQGRRTMDNYFTQLLCSEMRTFITNTSLNNRIAILDDVPDWNIIKSELETHAPTCWKALNALAGTSENSMAPSLGAAFCIIANTRSKFCNKLQKCIGLVLRQSHTKQVVFDFLHDLKICVSPSLMSNTVDDLRIRCHTPKAFVKKKRPQTAQSSEQSIIATSVTSLISRPTQSAPPPRKKNRTDSEMVNSHSKFVLPEIDHAYSAAATKV